MNFCDQSAVMAMPFANYTIRIRIFHSDWLDADKIAREKMFEIQTSRPFTDTGKDINPVSIKHKKYRRECVKRNNILTLSGFVIIIF